MAALKNDGIEFNGVTLLSSILNYNGRSPGYDYESMAYLPSYAAIAWHYKKVKTNRHDGGLGGAGAEVRARTLCRGARAGRPAAEGGVRRDRREGGRVHRA